MKLFQTFGMLVAATVLLTGLSLRADDAVGGRDGNPLDQGGETCETATVISFLPYTDSGTTTGYVNDYDWVCPYTLSIAPDVVYSYTPGSLQLVTFSLCEGATDFDTKLYVYAGSCMNPPIACNDDACSSPQLPNWVSRLECVQLSAGVTYYIVVDGYGTEFGNYTLSVDECFGCPIECPPGSVMENEPVCGDEYVDEDNGGCGSNPVVFDTLECGQTVCATTGTFLFQNLQYRDTDWYLLELGTQSDVTWTVHCALNMLAIILQEGSPNPCDGFTILQSAVGQCVIQVTAENLSPGLYFLWTGPSAFSGVPCNLVYWGEVACTPLQTPTSRCCYQSGCVDTTQSACGTLGGIWTQGVSCADNPCLSAINDLTAYPSGSDIILRWSAMPWATFYRIYASPTSEEPWTLLDSTTATIYTHINGAGGERLFYDVRACSP